MESPIQPLSAEYHSRFQPSDPNIPPTESVSKLFISESGMTRMDFGNTSIINDPAAQQTIVLDHIKKEARLIPLPPPAVPAVEVPSFEVPETPAPPSGPAPIEVKDLGKRFLDGHEVEGKQYVFPPPEPPKLPELPKLPEPPKPPELPKLPKLQAPGKPELPKAPAAPKPPEAPPPPEMPPPPPLTETVSQVWSSTSLMIPMLSRTITSFGTQVSRCKSAAPGEPDPAMFEIPPDYKQLEGFQNEPNPPGNAASPAKPS